MAEEGESKERLIIAANILLDTSISKRVHSQRGKELLFNFEIQLPSKSEYCIDWVQVDFPKRPNNSFVVEQWNLDEVVRWVEDGGMHTQVNGIETGQVITRPEIEDELSRLGLDLNGLASLYYPAALRMGAKGFVPRRWHSDFPKKE